MSEGLLVWMMWGVVVLHVAVTLLVALGGFLVWRWRRLFWPHMALLAWAISIPFAQWPCPLTDLEKHLRGAAGLPVYETHFIDYYFYRPLQPHPWLFEAFMISTPIVSYRLLARRRARQAAAGPG